MLSLALAATGPTAMPNDTRATAATGQCTAVHEPVTALLDDAQRGAAASQRTATRTEGQCAHRRRGADRVAIGHQVASEFGQKPQPPSPP